MDNPTSSGQNWSTTVAKQLKVKGMLQEYTNIPIPASQKEVNISGLEVKDKKDFIVPWKEKKRLSSG